MKIERFFYGMVNGKIILLKTPLVNRLVSDTSFQYLKNLEANKSTQCFWFPKDQIISLSFVSTVNDGNGRSWVQNQTLLIPIADYIALTKPDARFQTFFDPILKEPPATFEPVTMRGS